MGHWSCAPSTSNDSFLVYFGLTWQPTIQILHLCSLWDRPVQMSTTHSSFDQYCIITKLLVIEQLLHPALKSTVSAPWHNFQLCPSSQQILATPLTVRPIAPRLLAVSDWIRYWPQMFHFLNFTELFSRRCNTNTAMNDVTECVCVCTCVLDVYILHCTIAKYMM